MTLHTPGHDHEVLRYERAPRMVHALLASSFILALLTGLILLWNPLSFLAAGGVSRVVHRVAGLGFLAVPLIYLTVDRKGAKELVVDSSHYDEDDRDWLKHVLRYTMGRASSMPAQGRLNAGQKLHHATVIVVSGVMVVTGLILWLVHPGLSAGTHAALLVVHDLGMLVLTLLLVGHLYFTYVYKAISGMTTGYVDEDEARLEHPKWVEELEELEESEKVSEAGSIPAD